MKKIDLHDDGWAKLRDPEDVTERQRRPLVRLQRKILGSDVGSALMAGQGGDLKPDEVLALLRPVMASDEFDMMDDLDDILLTVLVDSWSYSDAVTVDSALDLPQKARNALLEACKPLMGPLLGETPDDDVLDPSSPTAPGSDSVKP